MMIWINGASGAGKTTLRWVLVHMIEEYARHNGHADLLRERLDGSTGQ
jgi:adenylylsulfate kinase-like enzyme